MSNPQPPGQQWDPSEQADQGRWWPGWPEPQSDWSQPESQVAWSGPAPQGDWEAQTQVGWDQPTPQNGWNAAEPVYETPDSGDLPGGSQPQTNTWAPDPPQEGDGWPTGSAPEAGAHRHYQTSAHAQSYMAMRVLAQLGCLALIIGGVSVTENGVRGWSDVTAWAFFAATAAVVQAAPLVGRAFGVDAATSWTVGAVATASLVVYWVLIVLPSVGTNVGFAQTMGVAAAVIGSWLSPGRQL